MFVKFEWIEQLSYGNIIIRKCYKIRLLFYTDKMLSDKKWENLLKKIRSLNLWVFGLLEIAYV